MLQFSARTNFRTFLYSGKKKKTSLKCEKKYKKKQKSEHVNRERGESQKNFRNSKPKHKYTKEKIKTGVWKKDKKRQKKTKNTKNTKKIKKCKKYH